MSAEVLQFAETTGKTPPPYRADAFVALERLAGADIVRSVSSFDFGAEMECLRVREAIDAMRARGVKLAFSSLLSARTDFLRLVRELGDTELVLVKRGRPKGALLSRDRWITLHAELEHFEDLLAAHRWAYSNLPSIPLDGLLSDYLRSVAHAHPPRGPQVHDQ